MHTYFIILLYFTYILTHNLHTYILAYSKYSHSHTYMLSCLHIYTLHTLTLSYFHICKTHTHIYTQVYIYIYIISMRTECLHTCAHTHSIYIYIFTYMYIYVHIICTSFYKPNVELWLGPGLIVGDPWCHRAPNAGGELFDLVARTVALKLWQRDGFGSAKKCA